jgi:hypothetical protein
LRTEFLDVSVRTAVPLERRHAEFSDAVIRDLRAQAGGTTAVNT